MKKSLRLSNRQLAGFFLTILLLFTTSMLLDMLLFGADKVPKIVFPKNAINSGTSKINFATSARRCDNIASVLENQGPSMKSQDGEDERLLVWFGGLCNGTYVELGALDGVTFSNSHVFRFTRQWRGVLIELMKESYDKLVRNRPDELATVHAGVCSEPRTLHYYGTGIDPYHGAIAGIYEFSAPSFRRKWWGDIPLDDPRVQSNTVECDRLDSLLLKHAGNTTYFDFLSLDVEGAELAALESVDFKRTGFGIILVEADEHNELKNLALRKFLERKGYNFLEYYQRSYWFVNRDFYAIYKGLIH